MRREDELLNLSFYIIKKRKGNSKLVFYKAIHHRHPKCSNSAANRPNLAACERAPSGVRRERVGSGGRGERISFALVSRKQLLAIIRMISVVARCSVAMSGVVELEVGAVRQVTFPKSLFRLER